MRNSARFEIASSESPLGLKLQHHVQEKQLKAQAPHQHARVGLTPEITKEVQMEHAKGQSRKQAQRARKKSSKGEPLTAKLEAACRRSGAAYAIYWAVDG